ncbi:MAG TPA: hypothetical protein VMF86_00485 [Stellaceae bacterium]|nr:hypothetical protein [Stellaceae bacterium]
MIRGAAGAAGIGLSIVARIVERRVAIGDCLGFKLRTKNGAAQRLVVERHQDERTGVEG